MKQRARDAACPRSSEFEELRARGAAEARSSWLAEQLAGGAAGSRSSCARSGWSVEPHGSVVRHGSVLQHGSVLRSGTESFCGTGACCGTVWFPGWERPAEPELGASARELRCCGTRARLRCGRAWCCGSRASAAAGASGALFSQRLQQFGCVCELEQRSACGRKG